MTGLNSLQMWLHAVHMLLLLTDGLTCIETARAAADMLELPLNCPELRP